jgi:hypothetical protein
MSAFIESPCFEKVAYLFQPYKHIVLHERAAIGPNANIRNGKREYIFGGSPPLERKSQLEGLFHELAHAIEIPKNRFGYSHFGFSAPTTGTGQIVWIFEREMKVAAIQKRLHIKYDEALTWDEILSGLKTLGRWRAHWAKLQSIDPNKKACNVAIRHTIETIDTWLPRTETLLKRWKARCTWLDSHPGNIKTRAELSIEQISPRDPFPSSLRNALNTANLTTLPTKKTRKSST